MIITIQPLKKGYEIYEYPDDTQFEITKKADFIANLALFKTGIRPVIRWLPIIHTPMAMKKTYPAKKKAVVKKAKKAIKKPTKK